MTFIARPVAPLKVDFLKLDYTGATSGTSGSAPLTVANPIYSISGSIINTRATFTNNVFTLYSGSHWRIEASQSILANGDGNYRSDIYYLDIFSVTNQQNVGFPGILSESVSPASSGSASNPNTNNQGYLTRGRGTAQALILSSDISTSEEFRIQIIASAGTLGVQSASDRTRMQHGSILKIIEYPA